MTLEEARRAPAKPWSIAHLSCVAAAMLMMASGVVWGAEGEVVCQLTLEKERFVSGEPVVAKIAIVNNSAERAVVVRPELVNEDAARLVIKGPDGKILKYVGEYWQGLGPKLVALEPGERLEVKEDIGEYYTVWRPGKYVGYALCRMRTDEKEMRGNEVVWVQNEKEIRSNEFTFQVEERNGKFFLEIALATVLSDGSHGVDVTWEVFTHREHGVVWVNCRGFLGRKDEKGQPTGPWVVFVKVGQTRWENDVSCLADTGGKLHVLYRPDKENYEEVVISHVGKVEAHDLWRPEKGKKPLLATKVYVQNAHRVPREQTSE